MKAIVCLAVISLVGASVLATCSCGVSSASNNYNIAAPENRSEAPAIANNGYLKKRGKIVSTNAPFTIFYLSDDLAWLSSGPELWRTENGGKTWNLQYSQGNNVLSEIDRIFFADKRNGWFESSQSLYRTEDSGFSWKRISFFESAFDGVIHCFAAPPKSESIFVGAEEATSGLPAQASRPIDVSHPVILRSIDRGTTWETLLKSNSKGGIIEIDFLDTRSGVAIGEFAQDIYLTSDGGTTWRVGQFEPRLDRQELSRFYDHKPVTVASASPRTFWIGYDDGRIIKSIDGGTNWHNLLSPTQVWTQDEPGLGFFVKMIFIDNNKGIGLKGNGRMFATINGGESWYLIKSIEKFSSIYFADNHLLAASRNEIFEVDPSIFAIEGL